VLIAGAPGSGKSTFAQAVLEMHLAMGKITKTIESPRDLMVDDAVVQYSFSYGSHDDLRDILLLSRPDYTVYDEVRNVADFELFKDLRLTGIGLL
jgi:ATPase